MGALIADEHRVWQVVEVLALSCDQDCPATRTHQLVLEAQTGRPGRRQVQTNHYGAWWTYPGRYPVCSCCGEPPPCREHLVEEITQAELARMRRFEIAGVCPACGQPVAAEEQAVTFPENLDTPLGPPVSFHLAPRPCLAAAQNYERRRLAADASRPPVLFCRGTVMVDRGGNYLCSEGSRCPGLGVPHTGEGACRGA